MAKEKGEPKRLTSVDLQTHLDALDFEPAREPYDIIKRDKIRDLIRNKIRELEIDELDRYDREGK